MCPRRSSFKSLLKLRNAGIFQEFAEGLLSFCAYWMFQSIHLSKVCWSKTPWVKFYFPLSLHIFQHGSSLSLEMCATPGACIKPRCFALRPLCHRVNLPSCVAWCPLCHKVNLRSCVARRPLCHKVTEIWSSAAPFHHDLWYFRHGTKEHF